MTTYIQHRDSKTIHILRGVFEGGHSRTECGKWYLPSMVYTPNLGYEREEDVVCYRCRYYVARRAGKKVYYRPTLREGLSKAKRRKLNANARINEYRERQRLEAWNKAALEVQT